MKYSHLRHTFPPVFDGKSEILVLGSFPSVKSRENNFYYGHPQNRFWKVIAAIFDEPVPTEIDEKKRLLLSHGIALWDVIASCDIAGSSDSSIKNAVPNDMDSIFKIANIRAVFLNGGTAHKLYKKNISDCKNGGNKLCAEIPFIQLPSTSPANAAWSKKRLIGAWRDEFARYCSPIFLKSIEKSG
ncbi:MAG: DNA-deoxyinosine glycosylase [Clostridiales bacterium]|nr:DNA-deoxyinosine glycosylase [Clostridiales bacterium]